MSYDTLFSTFELGRVSLHNRIVMAPMTRNRATGNVPNALMAEYYGARADAGLIITEGTSPSPNGLGYPRIPGLFRKEQTEGWRLVTEAVHARGGRIFAQLMHAGRVGHVANLPEGAEVVAPSAVQLEGEMYTDSDGMQPHTTPRAMTVSDIEEAIGEYVGASMNAIEAGFDGVELHGANGYLIDQFLNPISNRRDDDYGGDRVRRARFALEVSEAVGEAIGFDRTGIRLSPHGAFNGLGGYNDTPEDFAFVAKGLGVLGLVYLHVVDHSPMGAPPVPDTTKAKLREAFGGTIILSGGYDAKRAEADLVEGKGELVAFGRPFLANPDLVSRLRTDAALNAPDMATFYTPGAKGYTDYPTL